MPMIRVKENESIDIALRRFKTRYEKEGILAELKKREFYITPSALKKQKMKRSQRRKKY